MTLARPPRSRPPGGLVELHARLGVRGRRPLFASTSTPTPADRDHRVPPHSHPDHGRTHPHPQEPLLTKEAVQQRPGRRAGARVLLEERLVLAEAVCFQLDRTDNFAASLPATALHLLRQWVGARYGSRVEVHASDGLDSMEVPRGCEHLMERLRLATRVCGDLAMLWTADLESEFESDSRKITQSLGYWWEQNNQPSTGG